MKEIDKKAAFYYIDMMDSELEGNERKIDICSIGGTALTLLGRKSQSHDMDFAVSHEDFVTLSGVTAKIERKEKVRIDLMIEGEHVDYFLPPDYKKCAKKMGSYKNLNLYVLSPVDILVTKAMGGRAKDYGDTEELAKGISKDDLVKRFNQVRFKEGKKKGFEQNLNKFIERNDT